MARIPYLIRRKNVFYFRLVVPVELRGSINAREIIRSLKTETRHEAIHQALKLAAHYKAVLHDLRTGRARQVLGPLDQWTEKEQTQAEVKTFILDHIYQTLPEPPYSSDDKNQVAERIFQHVWQAAKRKRRNFQSGERLMRLFMNESFLSIVDEGDL